MPDAIPERPSGGVAGASPVLIATLVAGVASYVVTWLVPRSVGFADYATFAVFWAAIYLVISALVGVLQELTRATTPVVPGAPVVLNAARNFAVGAAVVVTAAVLASAPLWVGTVFPRDGWDLVWPLALGAAGFVMVTVLSGSFAGIGRWGSVAALMSVDALLRLLLVGVALLLGGDIRLLAWAVAVPFPLTLVLLWPFLRSGIVGKAQLDVGYRQLVWNVIRTVAAAAATGLMVSGLPLLIGLTAGDESAVVVGLVILTVTLVRAPLIIVSMTLQSYLIVAFRGAPQRMWTTMLRLQGVVLAGGAVLAVLGWLAGPPVFAWLFPDEPVPDGGLIALLVLSSAIAGCLFVAAPALLARAQHLGYTIGWLVGAAVTVAGLLLPFDFTTRVLVAVLAGPAAALAVDLGYLLLSRSARSAGTGDGAA